MKKLLILLFTIACYNYAAEAQATSSATQSTALNLSNAIAITFVSNGSATGTTASIPFTTVADYTNGATSATQQLKVQSNKAFNIVVSTPNLFFSYSGPSSSPPLMWVWSVLGVQVMANTTGGTVASSYSSNYGTVSILGANLITGCSNGGNQTFDVKYYANPGFAFPAGTYTANVVYTATQQ